MKSKLKPLKNEKLRMLWNMMNERMNRLDEEYKFLDNMCDFIDTLDGE